MNPIKEKFETIREMREAVIYEKMGFQEYLDNYEGYYNRKTLGKLWAVATQNIGEKKWKSHLNTQARDFMNGLSESINQLYEEGVSETQIASKLGVDVKFVTSFLV